MIRDELEAEIWRAMRKRRDQHRALAAKGPVSTRDLTALDTAFVLMVLRAADDYRNGAVTETPAEAEVRRQRRQALLAAVSAGLRTVHFQVECSDPGCTGAARACNRACWKNSHDILATTVAADVTCSKCQRSTPWLEALAGGLEATA